MNSEWMNDFVWRAKLSCEAWPIINSACTGHVRDRQSHPLRIYGNPQKNMYGTDKATPWKRLSTLQKHTNYSPSMIVCGTRPLRFVLQTSQYVLPTNIGAGWIEWTNMRCRIEDWSSFTWQFGYPDNKYATTHIFLVIITCASRACKYSVCR